MKTVKSEYIKYIGLVLGIGAPLGWLTHQYFFFDFSIDSLLNELITHSRLYFYMLISTCFVFFLFGLILEKFIKKIEISKNEAKRLSMIDSLTNLYNRRFLMKS